MAPTTTATATSTTSSGGTSSTTTTTPSTTSSTGTAPARPKDSTAEADNGGDLGSCPNCMGVPLRVGDSFIADVNRFGAAVTYATDNDVQVVQEALGTLNNSSLARQAVDYAYRHGVTVMASAADEAAQHNNWPSTLPHTIVVNSVRDIAAAAPGQVLLAFNGCTNFSAKITLSIPSTSCSSNAVGLAAGFAGLIYSAALNARDGGLDRLPGPAQCRLDRRRPLPDHAERDQAAAGLGDGRRDPAGRRRRLRRLTGGLGERAVLLAGAAARLHEPVRRRQRPARPGQRQPARVRRPGRSTATRPAGASTSSTATAART